MQNNAHNKPKLQVSNDLNQTDGTKSVFNESIIQVQEYFRERMANISEIPYIHEVWRNDGSVCNWWVDFSKCDTGKGYSFSISMCSLDRWITFGIMGSTSGGKIDFLLNNNMEWVIMNSGSLERRVINIYDEFDKFINKYLDNMAQMRYNN